jgi:glutamate 5-kinase
MPARKTWIAFARPPSGTLTVDAGAVRALTIGGASLLHVGVLDASGEFGSGEVVDVVDDSGVLVAKGLTRVGRTDLGALSSSTPDRGVVIHRDDLVILGNTPELVH